MFNLHIPTSIDEVKKIASDAVDAGKALANTAEATALEIAATAQAKAANTVQNLADSLKTEK